MIPGDPTLLRSLIIASTLLLLLISQFYWLLRAWRVAGRITQPWLTLLLRVTSAGVFALLFVALFLNFRFNSRNHLVWRSAAVMALATLWLSSGLFAFLAVKIVALAAWVWDRAGRILFRRREGAAASKPANLGRRQFVHGASIVAGAAPFAGALYGFAFERLRYQVLHAEIPLAGLPPALAGLRIAQLSDIHMSSYMSASDVRRAVDMANDLGADLAVVTGDFITRAGDPLEACIAELSRLRAPLGVWGCNGNHEIYADVQSQAAKLFERYGMHLLRQQNATLSWHGQPFNLIGVDYQVTRDPRGRPRPMLSAIETMVRRDMPNILLSHNPNSFRRAAELGIELMLSGHTHGGQVSVEILDSRISPARFLTPYIAGLFRRPMGAASELGDREAWAGAPASGAAVMYVNRGLGTIGIPVRLGVPPEITLHTLGVAT